jgi:hypothetical protein
MYLMVCNRENLIPRLRNASPVPIAKWALELVVHTFGESKVQ